jgi:hypothetical protein
LLARLLTFAGYLLYFTLQLCCKESPFEVSADGSDWVRAPMSISGMQVILTPPSSMLEQGAVVFVRYAWESMPQCSLYAGVGAPGTGPNGAQPTGMSGSTGVAATPFQVNATVVHWNPGAALTS